MFIVESDPTLNKDYIILSYLILSLNKDYLIMKQVYSNRFGHDNVIPRKKKSILLLAFHWGIYRLPQKSPHKRTNYAKLISSWVV